MNNDFVNKIKRFLKNKNTVTIVGVVLVLALLYFGYSRQVKSSVSPIQVPVAKKTIQPKTQITNELIEYIEVPAIAVPSNVLINNYEIVDKYTNVNTIIPQGSMFYSEALVTKDKLPDAVFSGIKKDEIPYMFSVNMESTYGNSIFPNSQIDIYVKAINEEGKIVFGKLLSDVTVVGVKDSTGNDVFENSEETRTPAYLIFGVTSEIHTLLRIADYLSGYTLIPVPHGENYTSTLGTKISTKDLKNLILSKAQVYNENIEATEEEEETNTTTNNSTKTEATN